MDAAQRLGEILLAKAKLTESEAKAAIIEARADRAIDDRRHRIKHMTTRLALLGRFPGTNEAKWLEEVRRLAYDIQEAAK